jgi:hypothetical protein
MVRDEGSAMERLIEQIRTMTDARLLRLVCCGFARTMEQTLSVRLRHTFETCERFADGLATRKELEEASADEYLDRAAIWAGRVAWIRAEVVIGTVPAMGLEPLERTAVRFAAIESTGREDWQETIARLHSILDCILPATVAIPFCPSHIQGLATLIYDKREWGLLPVLADALEEVGLDAMAQHCRQPVHAKGCHVLDSILGKRA